MIVSLLLLNLAILWLIVEGIQMLEVFTNHNSVRQIFSNVSYGFHTLDPHQCRVDGYKGRKVHTNEYEMTFTPNRRLHHRLTKAKDAPISRAAVVLAVGGHSYSKYGYGRFGGLNGLLAVWDSWVEYFFRETSQSTSLILLLDERDFRNSSRTHQQYLDHILINNMQAHPVDCVHLHDVDDISKFSESSSEQNSNNNQEMAKKVCANAVDNHLALDHHYRLYYIAFDASRPPLIIFATIHHFPKPAWATAVEEEQLFESWQTPILEFPYGYVKFTNWYSYYLFQLQLLDFFDYVIKLDNDVEFHLPFPFPDIPQLLIQNGYTVFGARPLIEDHPKVVVGVAECVEDFLKQENLYCQQLQQQKQQSPNLLSTLVEGGRSNRTFYRNYLTVFSSSFLVLWLGLYTAPEVSHFGKFWNDYHPNGMWRHRWGDQEYWPRPLTMFMSGDLRRAAAYHTMIIDHFRQKTLPMIHKPFPKWKVLSNIKYYDDINGTTKEQRQQISNQFSGPISQSDRRPRPVYSEQSSRTLPNSNLGYKSSTRSRSGH